MDWFIFRNVLMKKRSGRSMLKNTGKESKFTIWKWPKIEGNDGIGQIGFRGRSLSCVSPCQKSFFQQASISSKKMFYNHIQEYHITKF